MAVIKIVIPVFLGGALGAVLREFIMLMVPTLSRGFPLDILVANLLAALLLGLVAALHRRKVVSDGSTADRNGHYGRTVDIFELCVWLGRADDALGDGRHRRGGYVVTSLMLGYVAVMLGLKVGGQKPDSGKG